MCVRVCGVCVFVCVCVCVCVCVSLPLRVLIKSGVICTSYDWLNKFYSCFMASITSLSLMSVALALILVADTNPLIVESHQSWIALYKSLIYCDNH